MVVNKDALNLEDKRKCDNCPEPIEGEGRRVGDQLLCDSCGIGAMTVTMLQHLVRDRQDDHQTLASYYS